ncbi:MBL fold metallo-hydrolase [Streptomyces sp. A7024]|uniref:MBL fold metallo-hydrolase n=1 Tax=Streptomyces coryli TaxID=1128680 RepID=A0A6G4UDT8_9ACTN|nr:MBL fold metallo-hydrolase [Streptomyces coryli]
MPVEVTWWGHATVTVADSGVRVLTDPLFAQRLMHLRRRRGELPSQSAAVADVAVVSHLHSDHLHLPSIGRLQPGSKLLVPRGALAAVAGLRRTAAQAELDVHEVAPGDETEAGGGVSIRAVRAEHDGRRWPYGAHTVPALGYVIRGEGTTYFAGDTGLFDMAAEAGPAPDVALLPVGGWGPFLGHGHLNADRAAQALKGLAPRAAIPIHYGTYWPIGMDAVRPHEFHAPGEEFERLAARTAPGTAVHRLAHGESVRLEAAR